MSKVLILYKSGNSIEVECKSFKIVKTGGELNSVEWEDCEPSPLFIGVDNIEAVYEIFDNTKKES